MASTPVSKARRLIIARGMRLRVCLRTITLARDGVVLFITPYRVAGISTQHQPAFPFQVMHSCGTAVNSFYGVVLHEMAHVLGLGTLWTVNNNVNDTSYNLYTNGSGQYTGPNALAEWQREFLRPTDTFVPVELGGGAGTANGHWNEMDLGAGNTGIVSSLTGMDFSQELMTGWASNTFFVSRTTLGALDDLGYTVDYSKAGVENHIVVPEVSSLLLVAGAFPLLARRRRPPVRLHRLRFYDRYQATSRSLTRATRLRSSRRRSCPFPSSPRTRVLLLPRRRPSPR